MAKKCNDIVIIGAGLIGLCLAPILSQLKLKIVLIDQNQFLSINSTKNDLRTVAISYGTKLLLEKFNIWIKIKKHVQCIENIRVINRDSSSRIFFENNYNKDSMGYIIEHSTFKQELIKLIKNDKKIKIMENSSVENIFKTKNNITVQTKNNKKIISKLLVAADGRSGFIKSFLKTPTYNYEYNQSALVTNLQHLKNHNNTAYEIFLKNGPLATLPMKRQSKKIFKSSLIWSEKNTYIKDLCYADNSLLKDIIEEKVFPYLGKIHSLENIKIFPLRAHINRKFFDDRTVFVGDSAHSIHPIAGQGWNLGMRDVKYLVILLEKYSRIGLDIGSKKILEDYDNQRFADVFSMFCITHGLNKIFANKSFLINEIRSLGFKYINKNRKLNDKLVNYAMGVNL